MAQFDTSIARMKASFDAIAAAKTHTVVQPAAKPVEKPVEVYVEYTKKPEGIQGVIAEEVTQKTAKKSVAKKSKLNKLLRGKTVYDFS